MAVGGPSETLSGEALCGLGRVVRDGDVISQHPGSLSVRESVCRGSGDGTGGFWSHQVQMTLEFAGLSPPGSLPPLLVPPPCASCSLGLFLIPLGQRLEPPGKRQEWLMVIAARTGRAAAPDSSRS